MTKLLRARVGGIIISTQYRGLCHRRLADKYLVNGAWKRVLANDSKLEEKIPTWITKNILKLQRTLGLFYRLFKEKGGIFLNVGIFCHARKSK